jgi:hypothetical protein
VARLDRSAGERRDLDTALGDVPALLADRLALARGECGEEGIEVGIAVIVPVVLMAEPFSSSVQKLTCSEETP